MTTNPTDSAGAQPRLSRGIYFGYALGSVGTGGFATVPGLLLAFYLTNSLGVTASLAALVVLFPKLWDVIFLPIVGNWSDKAARKSGTRRPFLLAGGLLLPIFFILMFAVPASASSGVAAAWVFVAFLLAASAFAIFQVPYIAIPAEITDSSKERTSIMAYRVAFLTVAILIFGAGAPVVRDAFGGAHKGYLIMAIFVATLIAVGMIGCWWGIRKAKTLHVAETESTFREQFAVVRKNRSFRILLAAFFLQALATSAMLAGAQYYATYVLGNPKMFIELFLALVLPGLLFMPMWAKVSHKVGKKRGFLYASIIFIVGSLLLAFGRVLPDVGVLLLVAFVGIAYAGMQMFPLSMLPDTIAADAVHSGPGRAGAHTGFWTAGETTGFAIGPAIVLALLAVTGFVSSKADEAVAQPASAITGTVLIFSVLPAVLAMISLPFVLKYDLTPERMAEIEAATTEQEGAPA